jgi:hypothetical protein
MTKANTIRLLFLVLCLITAACATQTPIAVYITPTVQPSQAAPSEVSALSSSIMLTRRQSAAADPARPTVTWVGPIIGADYVLPATNVPEPTLPPPTVEGQPSPTPDSSIASFPDVLPDLDPNRMGVQIDSNLEQTDWDEAMRRVGSDQLAIKWIKLQIAWQDMQPNGPGEISAYFQRIHLFLEDADRRQLNVLLSVAKAPQWARSTLDQSGPPDDPQTYADFLSLMLREFGPVIDAIEIWNEPNLTREWTGSLPFSGAGYMRLFAPAYQAIRAYSPTIQIITAGLAPTGSNPGTVDDRTFMQQMYGAGLSSYRDIVVGIHPYGWANSPDATCCGTAGWDNDPHFFFGDNIRDYRQIMVNNGHSDIQMWVTEFGWASWEGFPGQPKQDSLWMLRNTKWDQANYTIRAFQIGQQTPFLGPMMLWNLNFATLAGLIENNDERIAYSLVLPGSNGMIDNHSDSLTERPLYWMIYDAVRPDVNLDKYD